MVLYVSRFRLYFSFCPIFLPCSIQLIVLFWSDGFFKPIIFFSHLSLAWVLHDLLESISALDVIFFYAFNLLLPNLSSWKSDNFYTMIRSHFILIPNKVHRMYLQHCHSSLQKSKIASLTSSIMNTICVCPTCSRFPVKLIQLYHSWISINCLLFAHICCNHPVVFCEVWIIKQAPHCIVIF